MQMHYAADGAADATSVASFASLNARAARLTKSLKSSLAPAGPAQCVHARGVRLSKSFATSDIHVRVDPGTDARRALDLRSRSAHTLTAPCSPRSRPSAARVCSVWSMFALVVSHCYLRHARRQAPMPVKRACRGCPANSCLYGARAYDYDLENLSEPIKPYIRFTRRRAWGLFCRDLTGVKN